jgi:cupin 2 domain-containing protein
MNSLLSIPAGLPRPEEFSEPLVQCGDVVLERIISHGHTSSPGAWFDQERDEWVALLQGHARLAFSDGVVLDMQAGDWTLIPAHCRHRVDATSAEPPCIWVALHFPSSSL